MQGCSKTEATRKTQFGTFDPEDSRHSGFERIAKRSCKLAATKLCLEADIYLMYSSEKGLPA
jgi:hypothetical protein